MPVQPRLGLLGFMLELYDRAVPDLKPREEPFAAKLADKLGSFAEVTYGGIAVTREEVEQRLAAFRAAEVDLIVVVHLSYSPSLIALPGLLRAGVPLVLFNTQQLPAITEGFTPDDMLMNHGMHGQQDLANTLVRRGHPFGVVTGHWEDTAALAELEDWAVAAETARALRHAEIGRIGTPFQDMGDFGLDETRFLTEVGPHVQQVSLGLLAELQEGADPAAVQATVADYHAQYAIAPDLSPEELAASARAEVAAREAVRQLGLQGLSIHYEALGHDPRFKALPFAAAARLMAEGLGFGGEGDVTSAAGVLMMHHLTGLATFSEMFTMDFGGGTIFMSHFAESNPRMARQGQPIQMVRRDGWVGSGGVSASLAFTMEPGPMTLVNLTVGAGGACHLIATRGEAREFLVPGQATPHFRFAPSPEAAGGASCAPGPADRLRRFLSRYLELGGSHHVALSPGDQMSRVRKCAQVMGLSLDVI
jgi:L-arabinose isomerase